RFSRDWSSDVCSSDLPAALTRLGAELLVVSPWYASLKARPYWIGDIPVPFDGRFESAGIGTMEQDGIRYAFIGHPDFSRAEYYEVGRASWRGRAWGCV